MTLGELTDEEMMALIALLSYVVEADGKMSPEEELALEAVVEEVGEARYEQAADALSRQVTDETALRALLASVARAEARELIFATVSQTAIADDLAEREAAILEWIKSVWEIRGEVAGSGETTGET